jgi:hypothetical protein
MTTETSQGGAVFSEALVLRPQTPMVIPREIMELRLAGQLPKGEIVYYDASEPDTLRLVDPQTFKPIIRHGVEKRISIGQAHKRLAAVILRVPCRTPGNSYEEIIRRFSELLKRTSEREEEIITQQNLGAIFIVEEKGEDQRIGWRQEQLKNAGLVADRTRGGSVIKTEDYIISFARRPAQRSPVDLTKGPKSGSMVGPLIREIENSAARQGFTADTSELKREVKSTGNPPRTIASLRDAASATFVGENLDGKQIVVDRSRGVETVTPGREHLLEIAGRAREKTHKPGDIVETGIKCYDCPDGYFKEQYYSVAGRKRWLLRRLTVCYGSHPDGRPIRLKDEYIGYLGKLL